MPAPFGSYPYDAAGIDNFAHPIFINAMRAPTAQDIYNPGTEWQDSSTNPPHIYQTSGAGNWDTGGVEPATTTTYGTVILTDNNEPVATKFYVDSIAIAGAPVATETVAGIGQLATDAEAIAGTASTGLLALLVTPSNLAPVLAAGSLPGSFTDLTATGAVNFTGATGALTMTSATASSLGVTGAGIDLTLSSAAGRVVVNGEEAAADAVRILSAAGGVDVDAALQINIASSQSAADAIRIVASAGGIDIDAVGAAGEDINITNTGASIVLSATESAADAIVINATQGGIDILASGAAAGEDIDITATGSSVNITSTENVADAIVINASGAASGMTLDCGTASLTIGTGIKHAVTSTNTAASPYTVLGTDYFITTDTTGGAMTVTLPAVPGTGRTVVVYDGAGQAAAGGNVTIDGNGNNIAASGTSAATKVINTAYESYILTFNGTIWCGQNIV